MAQTVTPPRGMRDFLPAEKARRERALAVIRRSYAARGFDEIETPVVEDSARLHAGLGGDNEKLAFAVMRRALTSDDLAAAAASGDALALADLGLRFDLTVPLARFYATHRAALPPVFRSVQIAPVWRAERPQKGRYRQFVQCDIDIIGEAGPLAELELLEATLATLADLGLTECVIRINDRRILSTLLAHWGVPEDARERALITIDKLDKIGAQGVADELAASGVTAGGVAETLDAIANAGWELLDAGAPAWLDEAAYADLLALRAALPGAELVFDPTLVRGMGYYTGTIFEIAHPGFGYSLGGGGRYDNMIGRFLGQSVPACGFSIGFERIVDLVSLDEDGAADSVVLVYDRDVALPSLLALKSDLVAAGRRVRLEKRVKNQRALLERIAADGFDAYAFVSADTPDAASLDFRPFA
ncbi:histidine--tRNA ligase [Agromyces atrinae]|uniref:Histidine--tRNA ligase n=1 Tax=Agromyces atrinae TaxID=592376 RepID=A0A4Q2M1N3_9MICO|nr:histidine--tRNA ligase [Agromyces atrinae]NYD68810.1 histidyl-tRNA synthetase [Agromyces atrinae]RXZ85105.1 histidine--tRNA ligase [Agromyces atrinae]RXZ85814.1 histidine--tRNA ligase [Agromyces atrinae]